MTGTLNRHFQARSLSPKVPSSHSKSDGATGLGRRFTAMSTPAFAHTQDVEDATDTISAAPIAALSAAFDLQQCLQSCDSLHHLCHWVYLLSAWPLAKLGPDGPPRASSFLPPPLAIGSAAEQVSRGIAMEGKAGRNGRLGFVAVEHLIHADGVIGNRKQQDIVYWRAARRLRSRPTASPSPAAAQCERLILPTTGLLFRDSAFTFNIHRIRNERDGARDVAAYPNLIRPKPPDCNAAARRCQAFRTFGGRLEYTFKAVKPTVCGSYADDCKSIAIWARD